MKISGNLIFTLMTLATFVNLVTLMALMALMTFDSTSSSESLSPRSDIAFPNSTADINLDGDEAGYKDVYK